MSSLVEPAQIEAVEAAASDVEAQVTRQLDQLLSSSSSSSFISNNSEMETKTVNETFLKISQMLETCSHLGADVCYASLEKYASHSLATLHEIAKEDVKAAHSNQREGSRTQGLLLSRVRKNFVFLFFFFFCGNRTFLTLFLFSCLIVRQK